MGKYKNMFKNLERFAQEAKKWSPERIKRTKETVRIFDSTMSGGKK